MSNDGTRKHYPRWTSEHSKARDEIAELMDDHEGPMTSRFKDAAHCVLWIIDNRGEVMDILRRLNRRAPAAELREQAEYIARRSKPTRIPR